MKQNIKFQELPILNPNLTLIENVWTMLKAMPVPGKGTNQFKRTKYLSTMSEACQ